MLSNYKADKIKFVEEEEEIETSQTHDDSLKHFDCLDFLKLTDDLAIFAHLFDHLKPTDIDANYVIPIMSKLLESANDQNIILSSILQFTSTHFINRLINFSDIFQQYLISMDISKLLNYRPNQSWMKHFYKEFTKPIIFSKILFGSFVYT